MLHIGMSIGRYRIVVEGELGPRYTSAFDGLNVHPASGRTEITGPIIDRSHLQGVLDRIADLGLTLKSVNALENGQLDPEPS
jgi:hypothetical protein